MMRDDQITGDRPGFVKRWWVAARPFSLPASTMSVVFGTAMAVTIGGATLHVARFAAAFVGMALLHVGANLMNDAVDYRRGLDSRVNPVSGAVVRGWITPRSAAFAAALLFAIGAALGVVLALEVGRIVLWIGAVGLAIGLLYSAGPVSLKYHALGDAAVFLDFGVLGALGAWTVQTGSASWVPAAWAVPMSLLVVGILHANNWRDIRSDAAGGIRTVASTLGDRRSQSYYAVLVFGPFAGVGALLAASRLGLGPKMPLTFLLTFAALPLALRLLGRGRSRNAPGADPVGFLALDGATAQLNLAFGLLSTAALCIDAVGSWVLG